MTNDKFKSIGSMFMTPPLENLMFVNIFINGHFYLI